jgi:hypothetical protein
VKNHRHGSLNPKAQFQKEITLDQVLRSARVADPLKLYDCCPFTDGAAAVVIAAEDVARRTRKPVWVRGSAQAGDSMWLHDKQDLSRALATERAAEAAYRQARVGPRDVDVVELHDCFTIAEILATEGLGLFEPGGGGPAAEKGETALGGRIPVNVSGGLKAKGHPSARPVPRRSPRSRPSSAVRRGAGRWRARRSASHTRSAATRPPWSSACSGARRRERARHPRSHRHDDGPGVLRGRAGGPPDRPALQDVR